MNFLAADFVPLSRVFLAVLLHFIWQASIVVIVVVAIKSFINLKYSRCRYGISVIGLLMILVAPLITATFYVVNPDSLAILEKTVEADGLIAASSDYRPIETHTRDSSPGIFSSLFTQVYSWFDGSRNIWLGCWLAGFCLFSLRLAIGFATCWRLRRSHRPLTGKMLRLAESLKTKMRLSTSVVIASSTHVTQAIATGVARPMVLIPASWLTRMPISSIEAVIAHELAHVRRWDLWINFLQRFAESVFFFHPLVWWLSRQIHSEREICCDELAVRVTGDRMKYVETLAWVASNQKSPNETLQFGTAFLGEQKMSLLRRVRMILEPSRVDTHSPFRSMAMIGCLSVMVMIATFAYSYSTQAGENSLAFMQDEEDKEKNVEVVVEFVTDDDEKDGDKTKKRRVIRRIVNDSESHGIIELHAEHAKDTAEHGLRVLKRLHSSDDHKEIHRHILKLAGEDMGRDELARRLREIADRIEHGEQSAKNKKHTRLIELKNVEELRNLKELKNRDHNIELRVINESDDKKKSDKKRNIKIERIHKSDAHFDRKKSDSRNIDVDVNVDGQVIVIDDNGKKHVMKLKKGDHTINLQDFELEFGESKKNHRIEIIGGNKHKAHSGDKTAKGNIGIWVAGDEDDKHGEKRIIRLDAKDGNPGENRIIYFDGKHDDDEKVHGFKVIGNVEIADGKKLRDFTVGDGKKGVWRVRGKDDNVFVEEFHDLRVIGEGETGDSIKRIKKKSAGDGAKEGVWRVHEKDGDDVRIMKIDDIKKLPGAAKTKAKKRFFNSADGKVHAELELREHDAEMSDVISELKAQIEELRREVKELSSDQDDSPSDRKIESKKKRSKSDKKARPKRKPASNLTKNQVFDWNNDFKFGDSDSGSDESKDAKGIEVQFHWSTQKPGDDSNKSDSNLKKTKRNLLK